MKTRIARIVTKLLAASLLVVVSARGQTTNPPGVITLPGAPAASVVFPAHYTNGTTVSYKGITNGLSLAVNDGAMFGPDTAGTTTSGIQEAINALYQTNSLGLTVGGGKVLLGPGIFNCTGTISIPNRFNFELQMEGAGKSATLIIYSGTTNFITLTNTTGGTVNLGATKPFQYAFRNIGFSYRYDTNRNYLIWFANKVNQGVIENCAFSSLQCITFTNIGKGNVQGQGGGLLFIGGVPANPVGTVAVRIDGFADNKNLIRKCDFYGLAAGVVYSSDHGTIEDCMFVSIGKWWSGSYPSFTEHLHQTAWTAIGTSDHSQALNNALSIGGAIIDSHLVYELNILNCYFMESTCGLINSLGFGSAGTVKMVNPHFESCENQIVYAKDENNDASRSSVMVIGYNEQPALPVPYVSLTNGTISTTTPDGPAVATWLTIGTARLLYQDISAGKDLLRVETAGAVSGVNSLYANSLMVSNNATVLGTLTANGAGLTNLAFVIRSNALSSWRTAPLYPGASEIVSSNGNPYMLLSTNGAGGGSASWTGTNKVGW